MEPSAFLHHIRALVARDETAEAMRQLRQLLQNSPRLDEVLLQSARHHDILRQIRSGTVDHKEADLSKNQIRAALLELLRDMETGEAQSPEIRQEMAHSMAITHSKNVVAGSISAGGNVVIGDTTTVTESHTSRRLRVFLYFLVPLLAITAAFLWYNLQRMREPLALTVAVDNRTPNPELSFEGGTVTLLYGDKSETKPIRQEADFKGIPAAFRDETLALRFEAFGFVPIDTAFVLSSSRLTLPIRRDNSLARIFGTVKDEQGNPLAGVQIRVQDLSATTDASGVFLLSVPPGKQRTQQRITAFLTSYKSWDRTSPVMEHEEIGIILQPK